MNVVIYKTAALSIMITFGLLGVFVYLRNTRSELYRACFFYSFFVFFWTLGFFLTMFSQFSHGTALLFSRASHSFGVVIPVALFRFAVALVGQERKVALRINYIITVILSAGYIFTPWFIIDVKRQLGFPYYPVAGPLYIAFILHWTYLAVYAHYLLFLDYRHTADHRRQQQIKYFFLGQIVAWSGAALLFPLIFNIQIEPITYVLLPTYSLLTTYAIVRHQLMDIEVLIKKTLQFAGLTLAMFGIVAAIAFWLPQWLFRRFHLQVHPLIPTGLSVMINVLLFDFLRNVLVKFTDKWLFQKKYDYKELLKKFTDEVMVVLDLKQVAQMTVNTFADSVKLDGAALLLLSKESESRKYELVASKGGVGGNASLDEQDPFVIFLRETHEPIGQDGELGKVQFPPEVRDRLKELNARLCLPLHVHEDLIGVLCLGKKKSDEEFAKDDLDILIPLSRTLAIAISNAKLVEENTQAMALASFREKQAMIGTLSAGINHEICNPLGIVKAQCEAYLLDAEDGILVGKSQQQILERTANIMRVALKQIDRATTVTQTLSNFAKPIKEVKAQPVNISAEVDEVLLLVGHDLKLDKIDVIREIAEDVPKIAVDRRQLQQVLFNLIRNAGQAIAPPGKIWVRAHADGERVKIEIADTGAGIPPDKLEKIGNPFFTTKEPGKGTGLGLFITRQLIESNKGRMHVESVVGKGTTFILDFPIANEEALAAGAAK